MGKLALVEACAICEFRPVPELPTPPDFRGTGQPGRARSRAGQRDMNVEHLSYLEQAISSARPLAMREEMEIIICRGTERGCLSSAQPCRYCYRVDPNDLRSTEQIARDLERGDA